MVLARLAANLRGTNKDVWNFSQQARALNVLMGPHRETGSIVAASGALKAVCAAIASRTQDEDPVLISGDPGSGKLFVAAKIHEAAARPSSPFIIAGFLLIIWSEHACKQCYECLRVCPHGSARSP